MKTGNLFTKVKEAIEAARRQDYRLFSKVCDFVRFRLGYNYDQTCALFHGQGLDPEDFEYFCQVSDEIEASDEMEAYS